MASDLCVSTRILHVPFTLSISPYISPMLAGLCCREKLAKLLMFSSLVISCCKYPEKSSRRSSFQVSSSKILARSLRKQVKAVAVGSSNRHKHSTGRKSLFTSRRYEMPASGLYMPQFIQLDVQNLQLSLPQM